MRASLRDRWFPDLAKADKVESEEASRKVDTIRELVTREGYKTEILDWLDTQAKNYRPKPGGQEEMLYTLGISDGLQLMKEHCEMLEREARRDDDD